MATIEQEDVGGNILIKYTVGERISRVMFKGQSTLSNGDIIELKDITLHGIRGHREALEYIKYLDHCICHFLLRPRLFTKQPNLSVIMYDVIFTPYEKWLVETASELWQENIFGKEASLGPDFRTVLRQVGVGLQLMHDSGCCHGNVLNGVYVNSSLKVQFVHLKGHLYTGDINAGIEKDVMDYKKLVDMTVSSRRAPSDSPYPKAYTCFAKLYDWFPCFPETIGIRERGYLAFRNPLVWELADDVNYVMMVTDLRNLDWNSFDKSLKKYQTMDLLKNWDKRVQGRFRHVLNYEDMRKKIYSYPIGLHRFYRNTFRHFNELVKKNRSDALGTSDLAKKLRNIFPEFGPVLFLAVVEIYYHGRLLPAVPNLAKFYQKHLVAFRW